MTFEQLLLQKNISVLELSKLSGVPRSTIMDMCNGNTDIKKASAINIFKISKVLDVTMEDILQLDTQYDLDKKTKLPKDLRFLELSLNNNSSRALKNLKLAIYRNKHGKQQANVDYWSEVLLEELYSEKRRGDISEMTFNYIIDTYLGG